MAFGATPVWPCLKSKNATPVMAALLQSRAAVLCAIECDRCIDPEDAPLERQARCR
jgi:hypothetical protein